MSPRRLDPSIIQARLAAMRDLLADLATVGDHPDLESERMMRHGVERIRPLALRDYRRYIEQCAAFVAELEDGGMGAGPAGSARG